MQYEDTGKFFMTFILFIYLLRTPFFLCRTCLEMIDDQPRSSYQSPLEKDFEGGVHFGIGGLNLVSAWNKI